MLQYIAGFLDANEEQIRLKRNFEEEFLKNSKSPSLNSGPAGIETGSEARFGNLLHPST